MLSYLNWAFDIKVVKGLHKEEKAELDTFLKTRRLVIITMSCFGGVWVEKIKDMEREDVAVQSAVATYQELETSGKATQFNTAPKFRSFCYRFITFNVCKSERNWKEMDFESNVSNNTKTLDKVLGQFPVKPNETPCAHVPASWILPQRNLHQLFGNASDEAGTENSSPPSSPPPFSSTMGNQIVLPDLKKTYGIHFINLTN